MAANHRKPHPTRTQGGGVGVWVVAGILALVLASGLYWGLGGKSHPDGKSHPGGERQLLAQMHGAAAGNVVPTNAYGGKLSAQMVGNRTTVVAYGIPAKACVDVGWTLAREGVVTVDGVFEPHLTPAILSRLCYSRKAGGATIVWTPYPVKHAG